MFFANLLKSGPSDRDFHMLAILLILSTWLMRKKKKSPSSSFLFSWVCRLLTTVKQALCFDYPVERVLELPVATSASGPNTSPPAPPASQCLMECMACGQQGLEMEVNWRKVMLKKSTACIGNIGNHQQVSGIELNLGPTCQEH